VSFNKGAKLFWFVFFSAVEVNQRFQRWRKILFKQAIFVVLIWALFYSVHGEKYRYNYGVFAFPFFLLGISCIKGMLDKYRERVTDVQDIDMISYHMVRELPISNLQVACLRFGVQYLSLQGIVRLYLLYETFSLRAPTDVIAVITTCCVVIFMFALQELCVYLFWQIDGFHIIKLVIWLLSVCCLFLGYARYGWFNSNTLTYSIIFAFVSSLLLIVVLKLNKLPRRRSRKLKRAALRRSIRLIAKSITGSSMLVRRELLLLGQRRGLVLIPLCCSYLPFLIPFFRTKEREFSGGIALALRNLLFIIMFAQMYGLNYLLVERKDVIPVMISPLANAILLRTKMLIFVGLSLCLHVVALVICTMLLGQSWLGSIKGLSVTFFLLSVYPFVAHVFSLQYYDRLQKRAKSRAIRRAWLRKQSHKAEGFIVIMNAWFMILIVGVLIFGAEVTGKLLQTFEEVPVAPSIAIAVVSLLLFGISISFTLIKPTYFSKMFDNKREAILRDLAEQ